MFPAHPEHDQQVERFQTSQQKWPRYHRPATTTICKEWTVGDTRDGAVAADDNRGHERDAEGVAEEADDFASVHEGRGQEAAGGHQTQPAGHISAAEQLVTDCDDYDEGVAEQPQLEAVYVGRVVSEAAITQSSNA